MKNPLPTAFQTAQQETLPPLRWHPATPDSQVVNSLATLLGWGEPTPDTPRLYALTPDGKLHIRQNGAPAQNQAQNPAP